MALSYSISRCLAIGIPDLQEEFSLHIFSGGAADGKEQKVYAEDWEPTGTANTYNAYCSMLMAKHMRTFLYATVYTGNTATSNTLRYSIESYAAGNITAGVKDLMVALLRYGDSVAAYFNK